MKIRLVNKQDFQNVLSLYKSVLGEKYCVWNEEYPSLDNIEEDFNNNNLFVLEHNYDIIACISIVSENELDDFEEWNYKENIKEIARIVVDKKYRGQQISILLVEEIQKILLSRGIDVIHLAVSIENIPAIKNYEKLEFKVVGIKKMYESTYYLCEKKL